MIASCPVSREVIHTAFVVGLREVRNLQESEEPRALLVQGLALCAPVRETLQWAPLRPGRGKAKGLQMVHRGLGLCSLLRLNHHFPS